MPEASIICPRCKTAMQAGFVPDFSHGRPLLGRWFEGQFATGWLGLSLRNKKPSLPIITYRCAACGYLESYAT